MSKAIGNLPGASVKPSDRAITSVLNQYLINNGSSILNNNQEMTDIASGNNTAMMLAQGLRNAYPETIANGELYIQIKNLQAQLPNNQALQQQYVYALSQAIAAQLNGQAGVTNLPQSVIQQQQTNPWTGVQNSLSNDINSIMYGASRALNGLTYGGFDYLGNKFGIDTQMNNYLQNQTAAGMGNIAQTTGNLAEYGGNILPVVLGGAIASAPINMTYNGYKIGKAYDRLRQNPFQGQGSDVIVRMRNHADEPVMLQRGEAIPDQYGNPIVHGKALQNQTGTVQNYGLNKAIYRHDISRQEAKRIPRIIKEQPVETNQYGQNVYIVKNSDGTIRLITSKTPDGNTVASMYYLK